MGFGPGPDPVEKAPDPDFSGLIRTRIDPGLSGLRPIRVRPPGPVGLKICCPGSDFFKTPNLNLEHIPGTNELVNEFR